MVGTLKDSFENISPTDRRTEGVLRPLSSLFIYRAAKEPPLCKGRWHGLP